MFYADDNRLKEYTSENRIWQGIPGIEVTKGGRMLINHHNYTGRNQCYKFA